jgi:hypothetical protein
MSTESPLPARYIATLERMRARAQNPDMTEELRARLDQLTTSLQGMLEDSVQARAALNQACDNFAQSQYIFCAQTRYYIDGPLDPNQYN